MLFVICLWVVGMVAQQESTLTQPPLIQTNILTLKINNSSHALFTFTTKGSYIQTYHQEPAVYLSLVEINSLVPQSISTFLQQLHDLSQTKFEVEISLGMSLNGNSLRMAQTKIMYLAYDFPTYPFIQLHVFTVEPEPGQPHQIIPINYPLGEALDPGRQYMLNAFLQGYEDLELTGTPWLYLDVQISTNSEYLLNLELDGLSVKNLHILRILIDKTEMDSRVTGPGDLICSTGTIYHYDDPLAIENNPEPSYLPFSMMYGIKGWQGFAFDLPSLTNIFKNSDPPIQANIGYLLFQTKTCPSDQGYVTEEDLCYAWSAAFYYQLTPETMAPCPYSCYQCVGPLSTNCQSCVEGWNRYLSLGRCSCIPGFYDPGSPICLNCTEAIEGCYTCSSQTNCLTCLPGCTAIGFSPIYCDCPSHVQSNYSFNCPQSFYYQHDQDKCMCLPQTYLKSQGVCYPCPEGCFLCVSQTNCLLCLDSYILVGTSCLFYYNSYVLLGQPNSLDSPEARCMRWDSSYSECLQRCTRYYYQFNCYGQCPLGTFAVTQPWLTCQPCKITCEYCYNFTVCFQCHPDYFYFNSTILACERCSEHCKTCQNNSFCIVCDQHYQLIDHYCHSQTIEQGTCLNCNYCLLSQCLSCQDPYYLNLTSYTCLTCNHPAFTLSHNTCEEICGDGLLVYGACDDGNLLNGDGCSSSCQLEMGFSCKTLGGRSRCWSSKTPISWKLYNVFGANNIRLDVISPANLSNTLINLTCKFNWTLLKQEQEDHLHSYFLEYRESTVLPMNLENPSTYTHIASINATNRCLLDIDQLFNYTVVINTVPQSLLIDYQGTQSIAESHWVKSGVTIMGLSSVGILCLGLGPTNAYATVRISLLLLVGYFDYYQMPINSFGAMQGLEGLLFKEPCSSTKDLSNFDGQNYIALLWKACTFCLGVIILQQVGLRFIKNMFDSLDWEFSKKVFKHLFDNRRGVYRYLSSAYEIVWYVWIITIFEHASEAGVGLLLLTALLSVIIIVSKVNLYVTFPEIVEQSPHMCHSLITDQFQNIAVALLITFSSPQVSYTSPTLLLFSVYSLASLIFTDKLPLKGPFYISENLSLYHYAFSLALFILIQALKCVNMWRSVGDSYESLSAQLGLWISLLSSGSMALSFGLTLTGASIRICEVRLQGRNDEVLSATVENMSVDPSQEVH